MKGSMLDIIGSVTLVFFFAVMAITCWMVLDTIETDPAYTAIGGNTTYLQQGKAAQEVWDWGIVFILFGSMFFALVSAYSVDTNPALFVFAIIVFMIALVITLIIANSFNAFYTTAEFTTAANAFPLLTYTMDHLVELLMVFGFTLIIVTYGKMRSSLRGI